MNTMSAGRVEALAQPLFRGTHTKLMSWTGKPVERDGQTVEVWTEPTGLFEIEVRPCMGRVRGTARLFVGVGMAMPVSERRALFQDKEAGHFLNLEGAQARAERILRVLRQEALS